MNSTASSLIVFGIVVMGLTGLSVFIDGEHPLYFLINGLILTLAFFAAHGVHDERHARRARPVVYRVVVRQAPMPPLPPDPRRVPSWAAAQEELLPPTGQHRRTHHPAGPR